MCRVEESGADHQARAEPVGLHWAVARDQINGDQRYRQAEECEARDGVPFEAQE
jgi:hypothetical protein